MLEVLGAVHAHRDLDPQVVWAVLGLCHLVPLRYLAAVTRRVQNHLQISSIHRLNIIVDCFMK